MAIEDVVINVSAQEIEAMAKRHISQEITEDSSVEELASAKAVYDAVKNASGGGTGGVAPMFVTLDDATGKASHTSTEILDRIRLDGRAVINNSGVYLQVSGTSEAEAVGSVIVENALVSIVIDSDGRYFSYSTLLATADQIGDISSALDEIREYAESLINGGGSV